MDTDTYCKSLNKLNKKEAIKVIHEAYLQLKAIEEADNMGDRICFDNKPVLKRLEMCLEKSGHIGFTK